MAKPALTQIGLADDLLVGVEIFDEQHRYLVAQFNGPIERLMPQTMI